ncbi:Zn-dependent hydrolase [Bradyrhizobium genosp. P]|uniref:Zn-dependent hydrolase n=1 Tax=Bradyrhizobium genosp. P TaxID=83641 RepID=UPI003CEEC7A2
MALATLTDPDKPYTRRCFTPLFLEGRAWLTQRFAEAGLSARLDEGGNLIGRLEGSDPAAGTIMLGSHSDTVPSGGRFDGIAGVLAGLEAIRTLRDHGIRTRSSVELVDFLSEEPSEYGLSCVGSRALTRHLEPAMLAFREPNGERLDEAMLRMGGNPDRLREPRRNDVSAFLELHIEQGKVLETSGIDLGVVSSIVGITRLEVVFAGEADHAGTTPLDLRKDALVAAAATITAVRTEAEKRAAGDAYFVATTGVIQNEPNAANVVPGHVRLVIEARCENHDALADFVGTIGRASRDAANWARVERRQFTLLSDSVPALCDNRLRNHVVNAATSLGLSTRTMASGAGHDAAFLARIAPMAMIFVPSQNGKSHCPEEWTEQNQVEAGAAALYETIRRVDEDGDFARPQRPAASHITTGVNG